MGSGRELVWAISWAEVVSGVGNFMGRGREWLFSVCVHKSGLLSFLYLKSWSSPFNLASQSMAITWKTVYHAVEILWKGKKKGQSSWYRRSNYDGRGLWDWMETCN